MTATVFRKNCYLLKQKMNRSHPDDHRRHFYKEFLPKCPPQSAIFPKQRGLNGECWVLSYISVKIWGVSQLSVNVYRSQVNFLSKTFRLFPISSETSWTFLRPLPTLSEEHRRIWRSVTEGRSRCPKCYRRMHKACLMKGCYRTQTEEFFEIPTMNSS